MRDEVVFLIVEDGKDAHFSFGDDGPAMYTLDVLQLSQLQVVLDDHLLQTDRADLGLDVGGDFQADLQEVMDLVVILIIFVDVDKLKHVFPKCKWLHFFDSTLL